jgi:hypothetical protein
MERGKSVFFNKYLEDLNMLVDNTFDFIIKKYKKEKLDFLLAQPHIISSSYMKDQLSNLKRAIIKKCMEWKLNNTST